MSASLIAFYTQHKISPVRQDIRDLKRHFQRREALYRHLGILPSFIKGKNVLEIGPGSGFNSLYTASLEPAHYVLVEGNPTGVAHIEELFAAFPHLRRRMTLEQRLVEDFDRFEQFDFVFCEGVLSGMPDPEAALRHVARFVVPGGLLVVTTIGAISFFPELLRRLFAQLLIDPHAPLDAQVRTLLPVFGPHLSRLQGMSRRHDDWIIDNLINPAVMGKMLSFPTAITTLNDCCDVYAASPHFITDWRWYKVITGENWNFNAIAIEQYWQNAHNFLDHTCLFPPRSVTENYRLYTLCSQFRKMLGTFEETRRLDILEDIRKVLEDITAAVADFSAKLTYALQEVRTILARLPIDSHALARSTTFGALFGRGQQYISFSKRRQGSAQL